MGKEVNRQNNIDRIDVSVQSQPVQIAHIGENTQQAEDDAQNNREQGDNNRPERIPISEQANFPTGAAGEANPMENILILGILRQFETLQLNLALPAFEPDESNPVEFLKKFEKYCLRKGIGENQKLLIMEDALKGSSKIWFETIVPPFANYIQFKDEFLNKFFSREARMKISGKKSEWENRKFRATDKSLQTFYDEQVKASRHAVPYMELHEIKYIIINQLPNRIKEILSTVDYGDSTKISQTLARLDLSNSANAEKSQNYSNGNIAQYNQSQLNKSNNSHNNTTIQNSRENTFDKKFRKY